MIVVDVQRAGPSTGMPTKTEQADLLLAMYGRHGESPLPIVSASTPSECFTAALEAARIAVRYRTPVILLSDTFIANSSEPWPIPDVESLPKIDPAFATPNGGDFLPYSRDEKLARPWAIPGTPGLVHRIGGLERQDGTGNISYDAANHELMTRLRQAKVDGIADDIPALDVDDPTGDAQLLVLGWGSSLGTITAAVIRARAEGRNVATAHLRHLNPFPANTGEVVRRYAEGPDPGDEHGAARFVDPVEVPGRRPVVLEGAGTARSSRKSSNARSRGCSMSDVMQDGDDAQRRGDARRRVDPDEEGLHVGPGAALVPRLRGLRDPVVRPGVHARARHRASQDGVRVRDRLQRPVHLLHGHLRDARDPRTCAGARDRHRGREPGALGVGGHRRRGRPLDRRQPPDPRAAAQRRHQDPAVQQPDLRADERPVLADVGRGQGHEVDAVRVRRPSRSTRSRSPSASRRPSWRGRWTTTAST